MSSRLPSFKELQEDIKAVIEGRLPYRVYKIGEVRPDQWFTLRLAYEWYNTKSRKGDLTNFLEVI